jgi:hypothetical protein
MIGYDSSEVKAILEHKVFVLAIQFALTMGIKHYRPSDHKKLETVEEILQTIQLEGNVLLNDKRS